MFLGRSLSKIQHRLYREEPQFDAETESLIRIQCRSFKSELQSIVHLRYCMLRGILTFAFSRLEYEIYIYIYIAEFGTYFSKSCFKYLGKTLKKDYGDRISFVILLVIQWIS
uniref:Ovule protein n=1 Tax=Heterorhabditis bacteriophora TaxID=37862 RepID=A0A1I7WZ57_HETBA